jgi:hypothetical protein
VLSTAGNTPLVRIDERSILAGRERRSVLSSLMRYCAARRIEAVIDAYMAYRGETTALACDAGARRSIARAWNRCGDAIDCWPVARLCLVASGSLPVIDTGQFPKRLGEAAPLRRGFFVAKLWMLCRFCGDSGSYATNKIRRWDSLIGASCWF